MKLKINKRKKATITKDNEEYEYSMYSIVDKELDDLMSKDTIEGNLEQYTEPDNNNTLPNSLPSTQNKLAITTTNTNKHSIIRRRNNVIPPMTTGIHKDIKISHEAVIEALHKANGLVTIACKFLNCRQETLRKYINNNKKVAYELYCIEETIKDKVVHSLYKDIDRGDRGARYFYLKCKAKDRGFIESDKNVTPPTVPITFNYKLVMPNYPKNMGTAQVIDSDNSNPTLSKAEIKQLKHDLAGKGTHPDDM